MRVVWAQPIWTPWATYLSNCRDACLCCVLCCCWSGPGPPPHTHTIRPGAPGLYGPGPRHNHLWGGAFGPPLARQDRPGGRSWPFGPLRPPGLARSWLKYLLPAPQRDGSPFVGTSGDSQSSVVKRQCVLEAGFERTVKWHTVDTRLGLERWGKSHSGLNCQVPRHS